MMIDDDDRWWWVMIRDDMFDDNDDDIIDDWWYWWWLMKQKKEIQIPIIIVFYYWLSAMSFDTRVSLCIHLVQRFSMTLGTLNTLLTETRWEDTYLPQVLRAFAVGS